MSNSLLQNHQSAATTVFHKLPKISLEGSQSTQNFLSQVHLLLKAAVAASCVHLSNYLIASLARSSLFIFPQHIFLCRLLQHPPLQFLRKLKFDLDFPLNSSHISFLPSSTYSSLFAPSHLFLGSVLIFASAPPTPQYLFCPPLVPLFRLSPTKRDCVTSWLEPSSLG